jgi:hypothetical protein
VLWQTLWELKSGREKIDLHNRDSSQTFKTGNTEKSCIGRRKKEQGDQIGRCYDRSFQRFLAILVGKIDVILKNQCYDRTSSSLSEKRQIFSAKFLKNHNTGPWLGEFSPFGRLFTLGSFWKITEVA